jgi:hypothetical protein
VHESFLLFLTLFLTARNQPHALLVTYYNPKQVIAPQRFGAHDENLTKDLALLIACTGGASCLKIMVTNEYWIKATIITAKNAGAR